MLKCIILYYHNILSKYQYGFKGHNSQPCLITMTKKCCKRVNKGDTFRVLLTDLLNALSPELFIARFHLHGFDMKLLNLIYDYLSKKKQRGIIVWCSIGINFGAIAIYYFSLSFIVFSSKHHYSKLRGQYVTIQCHVNSRTSYK